MAQAVTKFRSKREREKDVDLHSKYREIGIAAIAAANQSFRKTEARVETRRTATFHD